MSNDDTAERICELATPIILQKRNLAYYNVPPPRLDIVSPYPVFTREQLDMRRKVEVLKYSGVQQNTKTNGFTKKELFANLAKNIGKNKKVSQFLTNSQKGVLCLSNTTKPVSTTASDIPGPPMMLQYDPNVPLYNYGNNKNNRTYAITRNALDVIYNAYTENIINIIRTPYELPIDIVGASDQHVYEGTIGELIIKNNFVDDVFYFKISTPIAVWFNASTQSVYSDAPGVIAVQKERITSDLSLNIHIDSIFVMVYYNNKEVKSTEIKNNGNSVFADTVCNLKNINTLFYGMNYVGMLNVTLFLLTPPETVYQIKYRVNYRYSSLIVNRYLDFIYSGIFTNLPVDTSDDYSYNCVVTSLPTTKVTFSQNSFTSYVNS